MRGRAGPEAVFVVGCPRSGTSLLRQLLDQDRELAVAPETHFLDQWLPKFSRLADPRERVVALWPGYTASRHFTRLGLTPEHIDQLSQAGSPRELFTLLIQLFAAEQGAATPGEKTPAHFRYIDTLLEWFPEAHVLFAIRDPRSAVASLQALDVDWAQQSLSHHVRQWADAASIARRWQSHEQVTLVRYEDLVADTQAVLNDVFSNLFGRPFAPDLLMERQLRTDSRLENGSLLSDSAVSGDRVDVWRERLSHQEVAVVERRCSDDMAAFGYESEKGTMTRRTRLQHNGERVRDLARRGLRAGRDPLGAAARIRYRRAARHR